MQYRLDSTKASELACDCLLVPVFADNKLTEGATGLDKASKGALGELLSGSHLQQAGDSLLLHKLSGIKAKRLLLVCLGPKKDYQASSFRKALASALAKLRNEKIETLASLMHQSLWKSGTSYQAARTTALLMAESIYRPDSLKSQEAKAKARPKTELKQVILLADGKKELKALEQGLMHGQVMAEAMDRVKDMANLPGNICTPSYLADEATKLGQATKGLEVSTLDEEQMQALGMGALLSVSKGSREPARFIVMDYRGAKKKADKPIVLIGKGLTFDAGGISLKPGEGMDEMKYDMCGGASVIGTLWAAARLELPLNIIGLVPASENLPDGAANKPGDIVTSMSGQTIEILNTDAEGRLLLCDALTYAERFEPAAVIDIATLTGACVIALGAHASGLMANEQTLADDILAASERAEDRAWQLPLWDDYQQQLDSNFADMANVGGRPAGTITGACFLSRYAKAYSWAHLDIAGTAWKSGKDKGATARPLPLLMEFLLARAHA